MHHVSAWFRIWLMVGLVAVVALACGIDVHSKIAIDHARRAVFEEDRHVIREAILEYAEDMGRPPKTLEDLVESGYLRCIPETPGPQILPHRKTGAQLNTCTARLAS